MIACEKSPLLIVAVVEPLACASLIAIDVLELDFMSSDDNLRVHTDASWFTPLRNAVFSTGGLVTSWPNTPIGASTYWSARLHCHAA